MKMNFVQSGGFLGMVKGCEIDTETLPADEAKKLEGLVQASGISASSELVSDSGRDLQQYEISIEEGASKISAVFDDETLPQSAKPLVGYLRKRARPKSLE